MLHEFIHALIRMAWECYPIAHKGLGVRLGLLLERALLPGSAHILEAVDPMEVELSSKRVQAVSSYYSEQLLEIFNVFAAADMSVSAQAHTATMSFAELMFMATQSEILDAHLTVAKMTDIFHQVSPRADSAPVLTPPACGPTELRARARRTDSCPPILGPRPPGERARDRRGREGRRRRRARL